MRKPSDTRIVPVAIWLMGYLVVFSSKTAGGSHIVMSLIKGFGAMVCMLLAVAVLEVLLFGFPKDGESSDE